MADFSLHLNDDQLQIQEWVHTFAKDVIRPAAQEWDEREEFPWPIVKEAAKIGMYGWEFLMNNMADPTGLTMPVTIEELFWGDAGIGMAIMGSGLAAAGIAGNGTPEQLIEWADEIACADVPDLPEPEEAECDIDEECEGTACTRVSDDSSGCECACHKASDEATEEQMDEWRTEVQDAVSVLGDCPV